MMPFRAQRENYIFAVACSATTVAYDNASRFCKLESTLPASLRIDAYKDPLGITAPRIKVQVKHRDQKVAAKDVREMEGLLRKEGDIGLIVSSGNFTADAEREIRSSSRHIETMDLERVITLWQEHYEKLRQSRKTLLPLVKVFFLAPAEE